MSPFPEMPVTEPSSLPSLVRGAINPPRFVVGQDAAGRWIALEAHGWGGGLFRSREAALHYASAETGRRPGAVQLAAEPIRLPI